MFTLYKSLPSPITCVPSVKFFLIRFYSFLTYYLSHINCCHIDHNICLWSLMYILLMIWLKLHQRNKALRADLDKATMEWRYPMRKIKNMIMKDREEEKKGSRGWEEEIEDHEEWIRGSPIIWYQMMKIHMNTGMGAEVMMKGKGGGDRNIYYLLVHC